MASTVGHITLPKDANSRGLGPPTPTPLPILCGIDNVPQPDIVLTVSNADAIRTLNPVAIQELSNQIRQAVAQYSTQTVGLAEVFGGSYYGGSDVEDGTALATGAIESLKLLEVSNYVFAKQRTLYQPFWDGTLASNQIKLGLFLYRQVNQVTCTA